MTVAEATEVVLRAIRDTREQERRAVSSVLAHVRRRCPEHAAALDEVEASLRAAWEPVASKFAETAAKTGRSEKPTIPA